MKILFIGDSITDVGRTQTKYGALGHGYPLLISGALTKGYPTEAIEFFNRGISGNQVSDLKTRFETDCLALNPDVVSILIGINDTWHTVGTKQFGTPAAAEKFETDYREILNQLKQARVKKIILLEPFVLPYPADRKTWRCDLDPKIQIVRKLALEFDTLFVPLDGIFNQLGIRYVFDKFTLDGVHPTPAGHQVIAKQWLTAAFSEWLFESS